MRNAESTFLLAYDLPNLPLHVNIPACRPSQPGRKAGCSRKVRATEPLHVKYCRDPMPGTRHCIALNLTLERSDLVPRGRGSGFKAGYFADSKGETLREVGGLRYVGRKVAGDLSHLFVEAQLSQ
ncbi:hypothetical protein StoSoilB22_18800 [Arthrobacter sp. StoSoilB22]|nr:hypothetical protein StoSoilB22_18800 [Arthrobacter sp. StoSoilB22]